MMFGNLIKTLQEEKNKNAELNAAAAFPAWNSLVTDALTVQGVVIDTYLKMSIYRAAQSEYCTCELVKPRLHTSADLEAFYKLVQSEMKKEGLDVYFTTSNLKPHSFVIRW